MPALKYNKTATNVDLRGNPGFTRRVWKFSSLFLLRNVDFLKKHGETSIGSAWINIDILPSKNTKPSAFMNNSLEDDSEVMNDQENRKVHNRGPSSLSKKRQGSKIKKVSVLKPEDFAPSAKLMRARPPKPSSRFAAHARA